MPAVRLLATAFDARAPRGARIGGAQVAHAGMSLRDSANRNNNASPYRPAIST